MRKLALIASPLPWLLWLFCSANAFAQQPAQSSEQSSAQMSAQQPAEKEPAAVLEFGAAPEASLTGGGWSLGPTAAGEYTPIEDTLEIEAGVTALFSPGSTEWDTDLLLKKPWTLSRKAEIMIGAGPEWIHLRRNHAASDSAGAEAALDLMFWPAASHRFGWYLEPSYDYDFGRGRDQSVSVAAGLLISIP